MATRGASPHNPLAVVVVSYRSAALLDACLKSVGRHLSDSQVHVWDNHSEGTAEIRRLSQDYVNVDWHFSDENVGFAAAVNRLADRSGRADILLLNPDAVLTSALTEARKLLREPRTAATSPLVLSSSAHRAWDIAHRTPGVIRSLTSLSGYAGALRGSPVSDLYRSPPSRVGYLTGACLLVSRQAWQDVGPFDERFFVYCEEVDWARRARRRGWTLRLSRHTGFRHDSHGTRADSAAMARRSNELLLQNQRRYLDKYYGSTGVAAFALGSRLLSTVQRSKRESRA